MYLLSTNESFQHGWPFQDLKITLAKLSRSLRHASYLTTARNGPGDSFWGQSVWSKVAKQAAQ